MRTLLGAWIALACAGCGKTKKDEEAPPRPREPAPDARPDLTAKWIPLLADPKERERAITELEVLCDPKAIEPLGRAWLDGGRPPRTLEVMVRLARPLTPAEAANANCAGYQSSGRPASWAAALPFLKQAITELDPTSEAGIDLGVAAAEALGESGDLEAARILVQTVEQELPAKAKAHKVRLAAVLALQHYPNAESIAALAAVIRAPDDAQPPNLPGAAIVALGEMHHADALPVLLEAVYRQPAHFVKTRRAMLAAGGDVAGALRKILRSEDAAVNQLVESLHAGKPTSARDFSAAYLLGDQFSVEAVPDLIAALARPALPGYYQGDEPGPPAQIAILDALRKIGDPAAADPVLEIVIGFDFDVTVRAFAAIAYGQIPGGQRRHEGTYTLRQLAGLKEAELGAAAAQSLGRFATDVESAATLRELRGHDDRAAQIDFGAKCAGDPACLIGAFDGAAEAPHAAALRERAALDLRALGPAAAAHLPRLLDEVATDEPLVRQAILLAVVKIAPARCPECVAKLDAAFDAVKANQALAPVNFETELVRLYFERGLR